MVKVAGLAEDSRSTSLLVFSRWVQRKWVFMLLTSSSSVVVVAALARLKVTWVCLLVSGVELRQRDAPRSAMPSWRREVSGKSCRKHVSVTYIVPELLSGLWCSVIPTNEGATSRCRVSHTPKLTS
jgi:hypothetical protein